MRFDRRCPLTVPQQYHGLRGNPVSAGEGRLGIGTLSWRYSVMPTLLSREYAVRIEYRQGGTPQVYVEDPDLTILAAGRRLPHVYDQSPTRLCLYLPGSGEWESWMRLDHTIVPWTALWLFYFEDWLHSDEWKGGGQHPAEGPAALPCRRGANAADLPC
jgi:hypothetical protein